ncbi:MAG: UvrY/SirA/GacA family response regulator transcription factor [Gammaproteobacteria bacterium]
MIKLLVVDDHELVRESVASQLDNAKDMEVVGKAASGEEAINLARKHNPDVILMDLQMPGMGGLEATRKLLRIMPDVKILILTICDNDVFPARLLEEKASGYITKNCKPKDLIDAIKKVHAGQRYISPEIAQKLVLKRSSKEGSPFDILSEREFQVMIMITKGQKVPQIASVLHLSTKTVNTYRYRIFEKLGINNDVELTLLALRHGVIDNNSISST